MRLSEGQKGGAYLAASIVLWGLFPVVTVLSYAGLSAVAVFAWATFFATLLFGGIVALRGRWSEMRSARLWGHSVIIALTIGVLFYGLYFLGLESTTPGNAGILALFEVFTAFLYFSVFDKKLPSREHLLGAFFMVAGAVIIMAPGFTGFNAGDVLVLAATLFSPIGNYFQQKARQFASTETIMFLRNIISLPFIGALAFCTHTSLALGINLTLFMLAVNGVFLMGVSKIFWIEAIHRMPVPKATALESFDALTTLLFAWLLLAQVPTLWQLSSLVPFILGTLLLTDQLHLRRASAAAV